MLRVITQFVLMRSTKKAVVAVTGSGVVTGHSETSSFQENFRPTQGFSIFSIFDRVGIGNKAIPYRAPFTRTSFRFSRSPK